MSKLILAGLHEHMYQPNRACAYIYYGTPKKPLDQNGVALSEIYKNTAKTNALIAYLKAIVLPIVAQGLAKTDYRAVNVEQLDSPQPFVSISRYDDNELNDADIKTLKMLIKNIVAPVSIVDTHFLAAMKPLPKQTEQKHHGYNLRKRS